MFVCNKCKKIIIDTDPKIECKNANICGYRLHGKCANSNENKLKTKNWKCESCWKKSDKSEIFSIEYPTITKNNSNQKFWIYYKKCVIVIAIMFVTGFLALAFALLRSILISQQMSDTAIDTTEENYTEMDSLCYVNRTRWGAFPSNSELDKLDLPVHHIIILNTFTVYCYTEDNCISLVKLLQEFDMFSIYCDDIRFNFLIGGDGCVYEGRGWDYRGAHTEGFNIDSYGIGFIGKFESEEPTESQLEAAQRLLFEGVSQHKISPDYRLYISRQLMPNTSPADALYNIIKTWPHFSTFV